MEYFDIVDAQGIPTGETVERTEAHRLGIRHRTAHVWVVRLGAQGQKQVLLQQRSHRKDSFPDQWDTSSAGHIPAGSEPEESALRELQEELGITAVPDDLIPVGHFDIRYEKEFHGRLFRDNEYSHVYMYTGPVDAETLTLQAEEVQAVDWFDLTRVLNACAPREDWCCVPLDGIRTLTDYLEKHPL